MGPGMMKVLSRTLFVGGVTSSEAHLRSLFSAYGIVQTCIVNIDKRHAFVKMIDRKDAIKARDGMEQYKAGDMQLRVSFDVGSRAKKCLTNPTLDPMGRRLWSERLQRLPDGHQHHSH